MNKLNSTTQQRFLTTSLVLLSFLSLLLSCSSSTSSDPTNQTPTTINASMAWVSMREGLVQFDNGTQGVKTIGVIASREATPPTYASVKDLPGFYTRKTKADGTPRTVYLSMTDKMTTNKFSAQIVSVDGGATGFVSAIVSAPEILHPNTNYYAHFYEITGTTGIAIEKLKFKTENYPTTYPTSQETYSSFYNQITTSSTSPAMEYKASEVYLIPTRYYYTDTSGSYVLSVLAGTRITYDLNRTTSLINTRPLNITSTSSTGLFYDLYNITPSGPNTSINLWDGMLKTIGLNHRVKINSGFGFGEFTFYANNKMALVTE